METTVQDLINHAKKELLLKPNDEYAFEYESDSVTFWLEPDVPLWIYDFPDSTQLRLSAMQRPELRQLTLKNATARLLLGFHNSRIIRFKRSMPVAALLQSLAPELGLEAEGCSRSELFMLQQSGRVRMEDDHPFGFYSSHNMELLVVGQKCAYEFRPESPAKYVSYPAFLLQF